MFMNRWLTRVEIVELNKLNADEETLVFARLDVHCKSGAVDCFLEQDADEVIGLVRRRPLNSGQGFFSEEQKEDRSVINLIQRKSDGARWAASVAVPSPQGRVEELLVTENQAAEMLGVSRRTIFALNKQGILPSVMVAARKKYSVKMLRTFADGGEV